MPSDTPAKGDVTPSDVTVNGSGGLGAGAPPAKGGGLKNLSKNQKYALAGLAALVVGVVGYVIIKKKDANAAASTTSTAGTAPAADTGIAGETPLYDGQGSVGSSTGGSGWAGGSGGTGGNGNNFSNTLTQLFTTQDQSIAADIAALNLGSGTAATSGTSTAASSGAATGASTAAASSIPTSNGASPTIYQDLSDAQALQLFQSGALTASQALADETPAAQLSAAERNQQETGNKTLRAALK